MNPDRPSPSEYWTPERLTSALVACGYLVTRLVDAGIEALVGTIPFCAISLACIWFPEGMGHFSGRLVGRGITRVSPAAVVRFMGWVVLLFPLVLLAVR